MESTTNPEYETLIYKTLSAIHTTSFYFWASLGLGTLTIFSARLLTEGLGVDAFLNQLFLVVMGIPVGLLWWRYVINRKSRSDLVKEFGTEAKKEKETIAALSKGYSKKRISMLMRVRSFFTLIAILEGLLFIFSAEEMLLTSATELVGMTIFYAAFSATGVIMATILTFVINHKYKKDISQLTAEPATE